MDTENRAHKTYIGYRDFCQSFASKFGKVSISDLNTHRSRYALAQRSDYVELHNEDLLGAGTSFHSRTSAPTYKPHYLGQQSRIANQRIGTG